MHHRHGWEGLLPGQGAAPCERSPTPHWIDRLKFEVASASKTGSWHTNLPKKAAEGVRSRTRYGQRYVPVALQIEGHAKWEKQRRRQSIDRE